MIDPIKCMCLSKERFDNLIKSYCDTLQRNKDKLYEFYKDRTYEMNITFPIRINEIATMEVHFTKYVYEDNIIENFHVIEEEEK